MTDANPHLFRTSQPRELLACMEFAAEQAHHVAIDHGAWRWLIIATALAVQNACLCALDGRDDSGMKGLSRADAREIRSWTRGGRQGPEPLALREPRIVSPLELLRRTTDPYYLPPPWQLSLSRDLQGELRDLFDLRNTFLHFSEDGWTLDLADVPPPILAACTVIRHLSVTQPAYLSRAERGHRDRVRAAIETIETAMEHFADRPPP
jgi:hypothetical protein